MNPWPKDQTNPLLHPPPSDINNTTLEKDLPLLTETLDLAPHFIGESSSEAHPRQSNMKQLRSKLEKTFHLSSKQEKPSQFQRVSAETISTPPLSTYKNVAVPETPMHATKEHEAVKTPSISQEQAQTTSSSTTIDTPSITQEEEEKLQKSATTTPLSLAKSVIFPPSHDDLITKEEVAPRSLSEPGVSSSALEEMISSSLLPQQQKSRVTAVALGKHHGESAVIGSGDHKEQHASIATAAMKTPLPPHPTTETTSPVITMTPSASASGMAEESPKEPPPSPTPELATPLIEEQQHQEKKERDIGGSGDDSQQRHTDDDSHKQQQPPHTPPIATTTTIPATTTVSVDVHPQTPLGALDTLTIPFVEVPEMEPAQAPHFGLQQGIQASFEYLYSHPITALGIAMLTYMALHAVWRSMPPQVKEFIPILALSGGLAVVASIAAVFLARGSGGGGIGGSFRFFPMTESQMRSLDEDITPASSGVFGTRDAMQGRSEEEGSLSSSSGIDELLGGRGGVAIDDDEDEDDEDIGVGGGVLEGLEHLVENVYEELMEMVEPGREMVGDVEQEPEPVVRGGGSVEGGYSSDSDTPGVLIEGIGHRNPVAQETKKQKT